MFKQFIGNVHLTVKAHSPLDEVFLLDSGLKRVAEGLGHLSVDLPAGLYKLKFKSGDAVAERTFMLNEPAVEVQGPRIQLLSPVPLVGNADVPNLETPWTGQPQPTPIPTFQWKGTGSGFFFYLHADDAKTARSVVRSAQLLDESGDALQAFAEGAVLCKRVDCAPGPYRLRVNAGEIGYVEMCLPAIPGWRTALFMPVREFEYQRTMKVPDVVNLGILLSGLGADLEPTSEQVQWTEQARLALGVGRAVAPREHFRELLTLDWNEPMYLLFGAHLLLLEASPDEVLFAQLVRRLKSLLPGPHPDVELLEMYMHKQDASPPPRMELRWPPMLSASWRLLQDPFMRDRITIPEDSMAARAGRSQWANSVWFLWTSRHSRSRR